MAGQGQAGLEGPVMPGVGMRTNTMAIVSLVMAFVFFPAGIVLGFIALSQIRRTGEEGHGLAVAGLVVSFANLAIMAIAVVIAVLSVIAAAAAGAG